MAEDSKKLNMILIAVVASLIISLAGAVASTVFLLGRTSSPRQKVIEPRPELGKMEKMGEFVVNLSDTEDSHFLRATMELEQNFGSALPFGEELSNRKSQLRDIALGVLASKTSKELKTPEGKDSLKQEIKEKVNSVLAKGQISRVYFTEFAVQ